MDLAAEPGRSEILPQLPYKPGPLRVNDVDLLSVMREGEAMPATDRLGAALILTSQGAFSLFFAVLAQFFLTWGVVYQLMPRLGLGILDLAKKVAM
jgi:hypothetical protein